MTEPTPRLLLVDDDAQLAAMLHEFMELHGFSVVVVGDGESALDQLAEIQPDLVILDVMLPGMNGFDVSRNYVRHTICRSSCSPLEVRNQTESLG
jgi:DNA-binding response OmpR family regulator